MKILICGLPGSGKTSLACKLARSLQCVHLNADEIRKEIHKDLGFSLLDRIEHSRRMSMLCEIILRANSYVIADFVCPTNKTREVFNPDITIWMNTIQKGRFQDTNSLFESPRADIEICSFDRAIVAPIIEFITTKHIV